MATGLAASRTASHLARSRARQLLPAAASSTSRSLASSALHPTWKARRRDMLDASCICRPYSSAPERTPQGQPDASGAIVGRSGRSYSPFVVRLVKWAAGLMGYSSDTSTAIRTTSLYYDRIAQRADQESDFLYIGAFAPIFSGSMSLLTTDCTECRLPQSYQTWFQITLLHLYLLSVRFRSLPPPLGGTFNQELVNHAFIDFEQRLRGTRYNVTKGSLVKKYMKDLLDQQRGLFTALDLALVADEVPQPPSSSSSPSGDAGVGGASGKGDAELAAAIWRNLFGAGWGQGMGGVSGVFASPPAPSTPAGNAPLADGQVGTAPKTATAADPSVPAEQLASQAPSPSVSDDFVADADFAANLERIVRYIRREMVRLDGIPDAEVRSGTSMELVKFGRF